MDRAVGWKPSANDRRSHPDLPADACVWGRLIANAVELWTKMRIVFDLVCLVLAGGAFLPAAGPPEVTISNGPLRAVLYVPDARTGYYRGTRFDWSGAFASLTFEGHRYFGPWYDRTDPAVHDFEYRGAEIVAGPCSATSGPVEEFSSGATTLGFDEATPGGTFVKIGVGALRRPDDKPYDHYRLYEIADSGNWKVRKGRGWVEFTQHIGDAAGYGYTYRKTVRLLPGKPEMVLEHSLHNTGRRRIEAAAYDHNFLSLDRLPPGPGFTIAVPFQIRAAQPPQQNLAGIRGNRIVYLKNLEGRDRVQLAIEGFNSSPSDYDVRLEDTRAGAGMRVTADRPLSLLHLWSIRSVVSMEPFIAIDLAPGQEMTWNFHYTFYTVR